MSRDPRELAWRKFQSHTFREPAPDLAVYVARYWMVEWDYAEPYRQLIVPYPNVHLTFHEDSANLNGVSSGHVYQVLDGRKSVFGIAFHPGMLRPFLGRAVSTITDRVIPANEVFTGMPDRYEIAEVEDFLRANLPTPDAKAELAAQIVDRITKAPEIVRVDALAQEFDTTVRQLQRLFAEHVGVGPKWVIRRYRLHEVTEQMAGGSKIDWASLAADLGYADQAHFIRDFTRMFGETPTRYAERY
ncbi:helix-turn-helix domain-containing protein [Kibdelosporangium philippinense]|uniref:Helix-turn-helix domain-containing protein n=1 Tax=Kibdelosporangium philippinense TaxID=211113 RepID=A0ABS8ZF96_9PSEU|nr:helix-turn-helix domain-containing protein [Kibdelosporangium philippinense]MCE7005193.1 helix-turn-helix domain-containing protein [Kibdelosporangium philippinense]